MPDESDLLMPPDDPLAYMGQHPGEQEWLLRMVALYRQVWQKPGYRARAETLSRMANRHREYKDRVPNAVEMVIRKARALYDAGRDSIGANCSLGGLMSPGMFEMIFEAEEPAARKRQRAERDRQAALQHSSEADQRAKERRLAQEREQLRTDPEAFRRHALVGAQIHAKALRGLHAEPTPDEIADAECALSSSLKIEVDP